MARDEIRTVVAALGTQRFTVISVPGVSLPVRELPDLGVARMSTGPFTQRVTLTALQHACEAGRRTASQVAADRVRPPPATRKEGRMTLIDGHI